MKSIHQALNFPRADEQLEQERLAVLKSCQILDTEPEECFDSLVHLVQEAFDAPIALITMLDEDRLWFKAKMGVEIEQVSRKAAICTHAVLYNNVTVIHDLTDDKRFQGNPLLNAPYNIRFYAGAPIIVEGGYKLGTVCVLDKKPRHDFTGLDAIRLAEFAAIVSDLIMMRKKANVETERNSAKSEFLHELSHEMKTPLSVIAGISKILMDSEGIDEGKMKLIKVMNQSAGSLTELISTINDMELINNKKMQMHNSRFDLLKLLDEVKDILTILSNNKGLEFKSDFSDVVDIDVCTDRLRLKQVLINILGNAVKYTNEGHIKFTVKSLPRTLQYPSAIQFCVEDTGLGIPEKDQDNIFNRFVRIKRRVHHRDGAGLGLTITKNIVDEMGGLIDFESTPGQGSRFWVTLPKEILKITQKH